jgi:hypothetical protein
LRNEDVIENKMKDLRNDRIQLATKTPYFLWMRDYLSSQLEGIVENEFTYDKDLEVKEPSSPVRGRQASFARSSGVGLLDKPRERIRQDRRTSIRSDHYSNMMHPRPPSASRASVSNRRVSSARFASSPRVRQSRALSSPGYYHERDTSSVVEWGNASTEEESEEEFIDVPEDFDESPDTSRSPSRTRPMTGKMIDIL